MTKQTHKWSEVGNDLKNTFDQLLSDQKATLIYFVSSMILGSMTQRVMIQQHDCESYFVGARESHNAADNSHDTHTWYFPYSQCTVLQIELLTECYMLVQVCIPFSALALPLSLLSWWIEMMTCIIPALWKVAPKGAAGLGLTLPPLRRLRIMLWSICSSESGGGASSAGANVQCCHCLINH